MITYDISYSPEAIRDMDGIFDEVLMVSCDLDITHRYLENLQDKIEEMVGHPKTGTPLYYEELFTGYYSVRFKEYLAFYRLEGTVMYVDRVLQRKRDYLSILFGRDKDGE